MKKLLLASTALALSVPAFAADMPLRMPVKAPVAPVFSWSGCYLGGHVGVGSGQTRFTEPTEPFIQFFALPNSPIDVDVGTGGLGGGQVGCDYQFATNWVIGAAGDFSWANIQGQANDPFFNGKSGTGAPLSSKTDWLASAGGRIGFAANQLLLYGTGGVAWAHDKYGIQNLIAWGNPLGSLCSNGFGTPAIACNPSGSETVQGWVVGLGLEWAFAANWSILAEYDHYEFGTHNVILTTPNGSVGTGVGPLSGPVAISQHIEAFKFGLNYRLGWGSLFAARY